MTKAFFMKEVFALERERICVDGLREMPCPYSSVWEEYEQNEKVWKVYCNYSGQEKFVGYVWPYIDSIAPTTCPLSVHETPQNKKENFLGESKRFFQKVNQKSNTYSLRILLINIFLRGFFIYQAYDRISKI